MSSFNWPRESREVRFLPHSKTSWQVGVGELGGIWCLGGSGAADNVNTSAGATGDRENARHYF